MPYRNRLMLLIIVIVTSFLLSGCSDDDENIEDSAAWSGIITVSISYTGSHTVDNSHKIYVGLWYDQYSGSALMSDSIPSPIDTVSFTVINKLCYVGAFLDVDGYGSEILTESDVGEIYHNYGFYEPGTPLQFSDWQNFHEIGIVFDDSFVYTPVDLTGTWMGSITYTSDPNNPNPLTLQLTQSGNNVTGDYLEADAFAFISYAIIDGIVDINKLCFKIDKKQNWDDPIDYRNFTGTLLGDTLSGTFVLESDLSVSGTWSVIRQ